MEKTNRVENKYPFSQISGGGEEGEEPAEEEEESADGPPTE